MTAPNSSPGRKVSVVIPTLDNPRMLPLCLDSLRTQSYPSGLIELIVADNGRGGSVEALRSRFPRVRRVDMGGNRGFAAACNRGASEASGEFVAFLNDDAVAEPAWLEGLFAGLDAGGEGAVCAAAHIRSYDGREVEYSGASANLFGVGRPRPTWGWPGSEQLPGEGSPLLFASGGAMLVHRQTFLDAGGFDPDYFAYFEDVDLGWRLWVLGHKVVYAPNAIVRHVGGATGSKSGAHTRYTLWECNALATVLKNYEAGNMEQILTAGLLLLYKRALLSAGDAIDPANYRLGGRRDTNTANVELLPKVSVAHIAAIDRFNSHLPRFMDERRRIQAARVRPDVEILPLLGRAYEPQFAGTTYVETARELAAALDLYTITEQAAPNRVLVLCSRAEEGPARSVASALAPQFLVALGIVGVDPAGSIDAAEGRYTVHGVTEQVAELVGLVEQANAILILPGAARLAERVSPAAPVALLDAHATDYQTFSASDLAPIVEFCRKPHASPHSR